MKTNIWLPLMALGTLVVGCSSGGGGADATVANKMEARDSSSYGLEAESSSDDGINGVAGDDVSGYVMGGAEMSTLTPPALTEMSTASMTQQQRQVIRNGSISIRVPNVEDAEKAITESVIGGGGYVENTSTSDLAGDNPTVNMTIRVKSSGFEGSMTTLAELGTVLSKQVDAKDVTSQIVDLSARVKTLTAKEDTFREMLRSSRNTNDIISLQERLTQVRTEIERMEAQRKSLSQLASLSTIKVHLTQNASMPAVVKDPNWFGENFASTTSSFMGSVRSVVGILMWVVIYAPFWAIPVIFGVWAWRKYGRPVAAPPVQ